MEKINNFCYQNQNQEQVNINIFIEIIDNHKLIKLRYWINSIKQEKIDSYPPIEVNYIWEIITIDITSPLLKTKNGNKYILVNIKIF